MTVSSSILDHINSKKKVGWRKRHGAFIIARVAQTDGYVWLESSDKFLVLCATKELLIWDGEDTKNDGPANYNIVDDTDDTDLEPPVAPFTGEFKELTLEAISMDKIRLKQQACGTTRYRCDDYD